MDIFDYLNIVKEGLFSDLTYRLDAYLMSIINELVQFNNIAWSSERFRADIDKKRVKPAL